MFLFKNMIKSMGNATGCAKLSDYVKIMHGLLCDKMTTKPKNVKI